MASLKCRGVRHRASPLPDSKSLVDYVDGNASAMSHCILFNLTVVYQTTTDGSGFIVVGMTTSLVRLVFDFVASRSIGDGDFDGHLSTPACCVIW